MIALLAEVASQFDWTEGRHKNLSPSKPDSIWGPVMIQNSKLESVLLVCVPDVSTLVWSNEMFTMMLHFWLQATSSVESQRPLTGEGWMFSLLEWNLPGVWWNVSLSHAWTFRKTSQTWRRSFTSCMVVIFHSMWVVHLQLIPLLKTSSPLVRPHCLDSSDFILFYLNFFSQVESELSLEARVREGVVKKQVDFQPNRMWPQVSLGWKWALCSVSLSLFFLPPAK